MSIGPSGLLTSRECSARRIHNAQTDTMRAVAMHTPYSHERNVCPSVKCVNCDKTNKLMPTFLYHNASSFATRRIIGGGCRLPPPWNFGPKWHIPFKNDDFQSTLSTICIFDRSASAVTPSEKSSINTDRKSTMHFPMSIRWTSYVDPQPQRGVKNTKWPFFCLKVNLSQRKSATKFFYVKTVSGKVVRQFH